MTGVALVEELAGKGVRLTVEGGALKCHGPRSALTPEVVSRLKAHKAEVITYLAGTPGEAPAPVVSNNETVRAGALSADEVLSEISRPGSGPAKTAMLYYDSGEISWEDAVQWVTCAILYRRGESTDDWERHAPAVREVLTNNEEGR